MTMQSLIWAVMFGLLVCCQGVEARGIYVAEPWEEMGELVFDRSEPPPARAMLLKARQEAGTTGLPASVAVPTNTGHASASTTSTGGVALNTGTPESESSLPHPFDSSMGNNFTAPSCPAFFETFLSNDTFNECLPLSLLLQVSNTPIPPKLTNHH